MADQRARVILEAVVGDFQRGMQQARQSASTFGSAVDRNAASLTRIGLGMTAAGTAIVAGMRKVVRETAQFDATIMKLTTQVGIARDEAQEMGQAMLGLGDTGRGPQELGDALFFATSAGLRGADALDVVEASAKAASIGLGETKDVTDLVTSAMNAYGPEALSAEQATNDLIGAVREGKAEAPELAAALGQVLPIASEMGVRFDEVGAAAAAMTRTGTNAGTAAMQLRQILANLLNPAQGVEQAMRDLGMSSESLRATIREDGLWAALMEMRDAVGDNEAALGELFPNVRALAGFLDLTGENAADNAQIFESLADTTGLLADGFEEWGNTTEAAQQRFSASMEAARIAAGEHLQEAMRGLLETGSDLAQTFLDLDPATQRLIVQAAALSGGLLIAAGTTLTSIVAFVRMKRVLGDVGFSLRGTARFLRGPWGIAMLGAAAAAKVLIDRKQALADAARTVDQHLQDVTGGAEMLSDEWLNQELASKGVLATWETLGLDLDTLRSALRGTPEDVKVVEDALGTSQFSLESWSEGLNNVTFGLLGSQDEMRELHRVLGALGIELEDALPILEEHARTYELTEAAANRLGVETDDLIDLYDQGLSPAAETAALRQLQAGGASDEMREAADLLGLELEELEGAIDGAADSADQVADAWREVATEFLDAGQAMTRAQEENQEAAEAAAQAHNDAIDEQIAKLKEGELEQRESLESQKLTWEDFADDFPVTIAQVTEHLEDVNQEFRDWNDDLVEIAGRVGGDFATRLGMMGPEWAPIVAEAVDATAAELARLDAAMAENINLAMAAAELAVQMEILEEVVRQGSRATVQSISDELGIAPEVVEDIFGAIDHPTVKVDANLDPMLTEFLEAHDLADELDTLVSIITADADIDPAKFQFDDAHGEADRWAAVVAAAAVDADIDAAIREFLEAHDLADEWDELVATAKADADPSRAMAEFADLQIEAGEWDASQPTADLDADDTRAARSFAAAHRMAEGWNRARPEAMLRTRMDPDRRRSVVESLNRLASPRDVTIRVHTSGVAAASADMAHLNRMRGHTGGVVTRSGIRRFHGGGSVGHDGASLGMTRLAPDEVPAILQTRERVLSRDQNAAFEQLMRMLDTATVTGPRFHGGGEVGPSGSSPVDRSFTWAPVFQVMPSSDEWYEAVHMGELASARMVR